jgi:hypothetical protein
MYEQIQFIGYELYTGPEFINDTDKVYLGLPSEFDDLAARLAWLTQVIDATERALRRDCDKRKAKDDHGILRLFMIPEFFMRGTQGAYDMDIVDFAIAGLQALAGDARFVDWVFVFGTVVGRSFSATDPTRPVETYNICPVIVGGWDRDNSNSTDARVAATRVVLKEELSNIDFIKTTELNGYWARVAYLPPAGDRGPGTERQRRGDDGAGIFTIAGITFGLEICLDHAEARLKDSPPLAGQSLVQVQLIPSCGMTIRPAAVVAILDGWVFNVDGYTARHCVLEQVVREASLAQPIAQLGPPQPSRTIDMPPTPENFDELYADGPGQVRVYEPVVIPPARNA